jgi:hypothetical protein
MAARRYSKTCNPATDTWLSSAWPGLSDAEIMDACLRDGRWHSLGTLRDVITGALALPEDMQVGLGTYSRNITPATINGWTPGIQLCLAHFPVSGGYVIDGAALVHECVSITGKKFTITHKVADQTNSSFLQRDYTNYAGGSESTLPCSVNGGGFVSCSSTEALASHWRIYVRQ